MDEKQNDQNMNININLDTTPILYTDNIFISGTPDGIVLDFAQKIGTTNQVRVVSRIGMSRDHAKKFIESFEAIIKLAEGQIQSSEKNKKTN